MDYFVTALRDNPELAIFLTLAVGFAIGRVRFGTFKLGNVVGTLLAGVVIGQLGITVPRSSRPSSSTSFSSRPATRSGRSSSAGSRRTP